MKRWYVVQVVTGQEEFVISDLTAKVKEEGFESDFGRMVVPQGDFFNASGLIEKEKVFPGYLMIEMEMSPEAKKLVQSTSRIIKFLGGVDAVPLRDSEVSLVFERIDGKVKSVSTEKEFVPGVEVKIKGGPFAGFVGILEGVDVRSRTLRVGVSIFGRITSIDISFDQVEQ